MKAQANELFVDAIHKLNQAKEELLRPEEDLVNYVICKNAQFSIENFLKGYLLQNEIDPKELTTLESLLERCIRVNRRFENIDLSTFDCRNDNVSFQYCNDASMVNSCLNIANTLETFLRQEKVIS